jgi:hypothetical protein
VLLGSIATNRIGEPQAKGSKALPSVRRCEFAGKPSDDLRVHGITCNDVYFNVIAPRAFEQPLFETDWPCRNAFQHHQRLAAGTEGTLNRSQ